MKNKVKLTVQEQLDKYVDSLGVEYRTDKAMEFLRVMFHNDQVEINKQILKFKQRKTYGK